MARRPLAPTKHRAVAGVATLLAALPLVLAILAGSALQARPLIAQSGAGESFYVAELVGAWQVEGASRPLRPLERVSSTSRIGPVDPGNIEERHRLVLRNTRTARTVTWRCTPVARCRATRAVYELEPGPAPTRGARLFVQLGGNDELRGRVELLGARGNEQVWPPVLVLVGDGAHVDAGQLAALLNVRHGGGSILVDSGLVIRLCALEGAPPADAQDCRLDRDLLPTDCFVGSVRCPRAESPTDAVVPVRVDVYRRERRMLSSVAIAHGTAVIVPRRAAEQAQRLASDLGRELGALRNEVSTEEFRGLQAAAAVEIARTVSGTR